MFCSSVTIANKRHVSPKFSHTNVPALNYLLRSEIFISEDKQLRVVHLILDFQQILEIYQDIGNAIRAGEQRLAHIDVSRPGFLTWHDLPPVALPLQQVIPEAIATPEEEIASSPMSLEEEIDKFHFEEEENPGALIVSISDAEDDIDRHSGVHFPTLVITRPDESSEEEEEEMALNKGNKSLWELMVARNKGTTSQEIPKSQVPTTFPPPFPTIPANLGLKPIPNLKKKMPVEVLEEGEVGP